MPRNRNEQFEAQSRPQDDGQQHYLAGVVEFAAAIRNWTKRTEVGPNWKADTIMVPANQSTGVLGNNPQRKRLLVWLDSDAAAPVWVSPGTINDDPTGRDHPGAFRLMPGAAAVEMHHCGAMQARSTVAVALRLYIEYLRA